MSDSTLPRGCSSERRLGTDPRKVNDRRDLIRYEPRRELRRQGRDRRRHGGWDDLLLR